MRPPHRLKLDARIGSLPGAGVGIGPAGTPNTIDWMPPTGGNGCTVTGAGTSVAYTGGGPLVNNVNGTILDLTLGGGTVLDFRRSRGTQTSTST